MIMIMTMVMLMVMIMIMTEDPQFIKEWPNFSLNLITILSTKGSQSEMCWPL